MKRMCILYAAVILLAVCLCAQQSHASSDPYKTVENSPPQDVVEGMSLKFVRGLSNAALGWWELPKQIHSTVQHDGLALGLSVGFLKGIGMTITRTLSGVGEVVTFPSPFPGFYEPYFEPPFVWNKEADDTTTRRP